MFSFPCVSFNGHIVYIGYPHKTHRLYTAITKLTYNCKENAN